MTQKFYFHDAASTVSGTLPGSTDQSTSTPSVTATGASTNRTMNGTIGTAQVAASLSSQASIVQQQNWFRRFVSPPIAAQTLIADITGTGHVWDLHLAEQQSNNNSVFGIAESLLYVWRPSTGALVGKLWDRCTNGGVPTTGTSEFAGSVPVPQPGFSGPVTVTASDGDVLIFEVWSVQTQKSAMSYTNTFYYDGTTEDSATSNAAYLLAPADVPLFVATAAIPEVNMPVMIGG